MMDDLPESVAASSQQFAPKIGSASAYESDNLWSAGLVTEWAGGIGKGLAEEGFYFATADTLREEAVLPPLRRFTSLGDLIEGDPYDDHPLSNRFHWAEVGSQLFVVKGRTLYEWQDSITRFVRRLDVGVWATSIAYFDGYLHIAGKHGSTAGERDYIWVRPDDFSYGFDTPPDGIERPLIFHVFGGILYAVQDNNIYYTAGSDAVDGSYPDNPSTWAWEGPIKVGAYGDPITGIAGVMYQELGQRYVYVSTRSNLFVILPGDIPFGLAPWPSNEDANGVGMRTFYNKIFVPVGGDLFALQGNGDVLGSGVDNSRHGLPCSYAGDHYDVAAAPNFPFATIKATDGVSTVWANKASGWHHVLTLPKVEEPAGTFYSARYNRLFAGCESGQVIHCYLGNTTRGPRLDPAYRYDRQAVIDLGWYNGSLVEQNKYWHSVFVDVGCLTDETRVRVLYLSDADEDCDPCIEDDYSNWKMLGEITPQSQELLLGCNLSSKRIRIALVMDTEAPDVTPTVRAAGVRYTPKIISRKRWGLNVRLPIECLFDAVGAEIETYSQANYIAWMKSIESRDVPVSFTDLDGSSYQVLVQSSTQRKYNVGCDSAGNLEYDIDWSLTLVEACADQD